MKGYLRMNELIATLQEALQRLEKGGMDRQGLERTVEEARELYERLVVLRHKAREAQVAGGAVKDTPTTPPAPAPVEPSTEEPIRLDTRPPDIHPRQTSLIEAIAEMEPEKPARAANAKDTGKEVVGPAATPVPKAASKEKQATVAEKLEKAPVADLGKAIALSQKFWFVAELFNGDRIGYDKAVENLNTMSDRAAALDYAETQVRPRMKPDADPAAWDTFIDLIERRHP
jgi:hypothetical protein